MKALELADSQRVVGETSLLHSNSLDADLEHHHLFPPMTFIVQNGI